MIIAPDNWDYKSSPITGESVEFEGQSWKNAESSGLVFLPAAGYWYSSGSKVYELGYQGRYWSCSAVGTGAASAVKFNSKELKLIEGTRSDGYSVRLVCLKEK